MNKSQAIDLVKDTFESPFDRSRSIKFIGCLLKEYKRVEVPPGGSVIPDAFTNYVTRY